MQLAPTKSVTQILKNLVIKFLEGMKITLYELGYKCFPKELQATKQLWQYMGMLKEVNFLLVLGLNNS